MKSRMIFLSLALPVALLFLSGAIADDMTGGDTPVLSQNMVENVRHLTRVKILESNNVSLRPGSIYDNITYFESLLDLPRPGFNYEFFDTGLGAAEPLYPMYQKGYQGSYLQLLAALVSDKNRHIDHYTPGLKTPEGCVVDGMYLLRSMDEYPPDFLKKEREEGFDLVVTRLEYYTRLRPDAQCGRHRANDPDPNFDPMKYMKDHHNAMSLADFPTEHLQQFEAKFSVIHHITEERGTHKYRRFDLRNLTKNTLWYYPDGHTEDYDINTPRPQTGMSWFRLPRHMQVPATAAVQDKFPLDSLVSAADFGKLLDFLSGKPTPDFDPSHEPGNDTFRLSDVTPNFIYTSGLELENINDPVGDVSNPKHFKMVGMAIKPYEQQDDISWQGLKVIPQVRFVFQLIDPRHNRPYEQLFFHLKWDVVDRLADDQTRNAQHQYFLTRVDQLTQARETNDPNYETILEKFIGEFTAARLMESLNFSTSMTGVWVFGSMARSYNAARDLKAVRVVRDGVDVGYYSSAYDNDIFRAAVKAATGDRQKLLQQHMDDLTMSAYHDPKREDAHNITFARMTCAQCHQTAARDGIHMALNDGLDRRITTPLNVSEFFFHDADVQLETGQRFWLNAR